MNWKKKVLVTGGASFIGSHLVDALVSSGAQVRIADDFSSGKRENIQHHLSHKSVEVFTGDLRDTAFAKKAVHGMQLVFHLACDHGGRGYLDMHQANTSTNFILDGTVFFESKKAGVDKIIFASSGCVYPMSLQSDTSASVFLKEAQVGPPYEADNMYGWAKLMGEKTLQAYHDEWGMKTASCRFFTVYGERGVENHAVIAMIARAFIRQDPFYVWGDGTQIRNWTYVGDIVDGLLAAAQYVDDGTAINLGTMEGIRVIDAVHEILRYTKHTPAIIFERDKPVGPLNRVADNALAKKVLHWQPKFSFVEGLHRTIDWYFSTKDKSTVSRSLHDLLLQR